MAITLLVAFLWPFAVLAQEEEEDELSFPLENFYAKRKKNARSLFRNFRFSFSTGYGRTFVNNPIDGFAVYQAPGVAPAVFVAGGPPATRYTNWITDMVSDGSAPNPSAFLVSSDTTKMSFSGGGWNLPFKASIHYEWQGKYRIGGGYSYEMMSLGSLSPSKYADQIGNFQPPNASGWMSKYYGMLGVSFYRLGNYLFTGDLEIGGFNPGSNYNSTLVEPGMYYSLGVTVERELSEYLRVFARPSYELKSYAITIPEGGSSMNVYMNGAYLHVGISYSIPDLPKCYNKDCRIQINHAHGNKEYRSRVHPVYKKQNPQYGENHPNLIKYKRKNRKKMNPY